jgi:hypothetical protein
MDRRAHNAPVLAVHVDVRPPPGVSIDTPLLLPWPGHSAQPVNTGQCSVCGQPAPLSVVPSGSNLVARVPAECGSSRFQCGSKVVSAGSSVVPGGSSVVPVWFQCGSKVVPAKSVPVWFQVVPLSQVVPVTNPVSRTVARGSRSGQVVPSGSSVVPAGSSVVPGGSKVVPSGSDESKVVPAGSNQGDQFQVTVVPRRFHWQPGSVLPVRGWFPPPSSAKRA